MSDAREAGQLVLGNLDSMAEAARHAVVSLTRDATTASPYADQPNHHRAGRVLDLWQSGREGRRVMDASGAPPRAPYDSSRGPPTHSLGHVRG